MDAWARVRYAHFNHLPSVSHKIDQTMIDRKNISTLGIVNGNPSTATTSREFVDGSTRTHVVLRTAAIGFGTYKPGWRWSLHAGPQVGKDSENHIGYIISGRMKLEDTSGNEIEIGPGDAFEIEAGSDAWVLGDEPCIALDFIPLQK